jgi:hypothetical protein
MSFTKLPVELIVMIINYLSIDDRIAFRSTCTLFYDFISIEALMKMKFPILYKKNIGKAWVWGATKNEFRLISYLDRENNASEDPNISKLFMHFCPFNYMKYMLGKEGMTFERFLKINPLYAFRYVNSDELNDLIHLLTNNTEQIPYSVILENIHIIRDRIIHENDEGILNYTLICFNIKITDLFPTETEINKVIRKKAINIFRELCSYNEISNQVLYNALKKRINANEYRNNRTRKILKLCIATDDVHTLKKFQEDYRYSLKEIFSSWEDLRDIIIANAMNIFRYAIKNGIKGQALSNSKILSAILGYCVKDI